MLNIVITGSQQKTVGVKYMYISEVIILSREYIGLTY